MLDFLLKPRSVAVVGASRKRGTIGGEIFHNLVSRGFPGPVYPVNPTTPVVQSVRAYASVAELPEPPDLAVIVVPARRVLDAVRQCAEAGVKSVIVISAGFAEVGDRGRRAQLEVLELVRKSGMRLVGPNCLGLLNTDPEVNLNATFVPTWPPEGNVAFLSQSGALGLAILEKARELGIGISQFVSVGNKADVSGNDLLEYWEDDDRTRVILLYLESFGNPARFTQIARRVARKKPIVAVKSGRTEAGARAAGSHTGSLAGMDVAVDGLLAQSGVLRTDTMEEMFDLALLFANQPVPRGRRVGLLTNAGGPAIMAADACESRGLEVATLSAETERALRELLPEEASVKNPVDMIASATAREFERGLELLLADENVDSVIVLFVPPLVTGAVDVAAAIRKAGAGSSKPIVTCFMGSHGVPEALSSLRDGRYPSYSFPEAAAIAVSRAARYGEWLRRPEPSPVELTGLNAQEARGVVSRALQQAPEQGRWLAPEEVCALLSSYGIRLPGSRIARGADEAAAAAGELGYPVALKVVAEDVLHKSDVGGVQLDLADAGAVRAAFETARRNLAQAGHEGIEKVLVQRMVPRGVETFVGVTSDRVFGRLVGFGIGGVNVEIWRDVVFRVHPLTSDDAREMLAQIRAVRLLDGYRGNPAADREALVETILRVDRMLTDLPEIRELDLNPLLALPPGRGAVAVDARVRVARSPG